MRNCELVKRREQKEVDKVALEELEKQRVEALKLVKKEREIVEQERAVYESIAVKISKRHTSHNIRAETNTCTIRLFNRFDSIRMLLQLFEYSFEVF